jgi:hypothetical protein
MARSPSTLGMRPSSGAGWPVVGRWEWRRLAGPIWIAFTLFLAAYFVANLPAFVRDSQSVCIASNPGDCPSGALTLGYVHALRQMHVSIPLAADILAALTLAVSLAYWAFGLLIFWRKGREEIGLLTSLLLVMVGAVGIDAFSRPGPSLLEVITNIINTSMSLGLALFLYTFPTGRFTPRWTWIACVLSLPAIFLASLPISPPPVVSDAFGLAILFPLAIQIYRYRRVYDAVQRQQTKWFVSGVGLFIALFILIGVVQDIAPRSVWYQLVNGPMWILIWTVMLLSVSIPILRYRLWDIDVLINRTLVYGSLTLSLLTVYIGGVIGLQALFRTVTGQSSGLAVALVTLMVAALFNPWRHRLQGFIDHRFYRRRYDATKILDALSSHLRDEVNLDVLMQDILAVTDEAMQPASVSLWLRADS